MSLAHPAQITNSIYSVLSLAEKALVSISSTPRLDVHVLLSHVCRKTRSQLLADHHEALTSVQAKQFQSLLSQRKQGEPVAYLIGEKEFYGRSFLVDKRVLIPRPETELLVELALQTISTNRHPLTVIDLGTGSANIITTLVCELKNRPGINFLATDLSSDALRVAKRNAKRHGVDDQITFLKGSLLDPVLDLLTVNRQLLIVGNLPYVADHWVKDLPPGIQYYEPEVALAGGSTGLEIYEQLFHQLRGLLVTGQVSTVHLYVEHDPRQSSEITEMIVEYLDGQVITHQDLARLPRVLEFIPATYTRQ